MALTDRPTSIKFLALGFIFWLAAVGTSALGASSHPSAKRIEKPYFSQTGRGSYYGSKHDGKTAADGSTFDRHDFTGAHLTLPLGTTVHVTNLSNGRTVQVRITDRGPRVRGRVIDVSAAAARELGMQKRGIAKVRIRAMRSDQE